MTRFHSLVAALLAVLIVAPALAQPAPAPADVIAEQRAHYPIDVCVVTGMKLGSMGDPYDLAHEGRLVRFCCKACRPKFEADPSTYLAKLDKMILEQQVKAYPLETCEVTGMKLGSMGDPYEHLDGNRLVRFCCKACVPKYRQDRAKYRKLIDDAYAAKQRASYPTTSCVVSGEALEEGELVEFVVGTTLVRVCCQGCRRKVMKDPDQYLAKLREARTKKADG